MQGRLRGLQATSGPFELVALLQKGELVIYLDRFETNDPLSGANVTVETPAGPVAANAQGRCVSALGALGARQDHTT